MKTKVMGLFVATFLIFSAFGVLALNPASYNGLAHPGQTSQLYLYEKDSNWDIVEDGAWGKLIMKKNGFVFNGHGLVPGESYSLLDNAEWGVTVEVEATGTADKNGNLHLSGDSLIDGGDSGKVWLVLSDDVDTQMTAWNPTEYLFEYNLI